MNSSYRERQAPSDPEPSAAILKWASTPGPSAPMPPQSPLLGFRDPLIERAYLDAVYRRNRKYYAVSLLVMTLLIASFIWTDPWLLPPAARSTFKAARTYFLVPISLLSTINTIWITNSILWIRLSVLFVVCFGFAHAFLLFVNGIQVFEYLELGILQVILGTFLLVGLPIRWSLAVVIAFGFGFGICTLHVQTGSAPFANFGADFVVYSCIGGFAAYRYENASRREFIAQAFSRKEYSERVATDTDRRRWLEVIADFLRHELKNSMTAISTSIEMADRAAPQSDAGKYLDRGRRSVQYMDQLLTKVADATNLEAALSQQEFEPIELSKLVVDRVDDYRKDNQGRTFATDVEPDVHILGHGDSLVQMLDKLVNNALEHGDPAHPIQIQLRGEPISCIITVTDEGDALPADVSQIFEPFVSQKTPSSGVPNLGLGLFVARAIVKNHGGRIWAEGLMGPVGASFIIELPRLGQTPSNWDPSIAAPTLGSNPIEPRFDS